MEKPKFVYVTYITTTPEKLWNALLNSEMTRQYWGNRTNASDWKPGSRWEHRDADDAKLVDIVGKVVESDPPRKLVLTWADPKEEARPEAYSRVTLELVQFGELVRLTVTHEDFEVEVAFGNGQANADDEQQKRLAAEELRICLFVEERRVIRARRLQRSASSRARLRKSSCEIVFPSQA